jgi:hypothetical protein
MPFKDEAALIPTASFATIEMWWVSPLSSHLLASHRKFEGTTMVDTRHLLSEHKSSSIHLNSSTLSTFDTGVSSPLRPSSRIYSRPP